MSTDRDTTRIVRSWLRSPIHASADRVLDGVIDGLDTTPQHRVPPWPVRRIPDMNTAMRFALAAAAVVVVALLGIRFLVPGGSLGGPGQTSTAIPTATPAPLPTEGGVLDPGTYITHPFSDFAGPSLASPNDSLTVTFAVPDGWERAPTSGVSHATAGPAGPSGASMTFWLVTGLYSDPCQADYSGTPDVVVGPTVDDLANAFVEQTAYEATTPTDVTLSGYSGKRVDLQLPSGDNPDALFNRGDRFGAACSNGGYFIWDGSIYAQGPDNRWHLWILDVVGTRVVILAEDFATTSAQHQEELMAIVESIRIEP
jgi:hypothetical protein